MKRWAKIRGESEPSTPEPPKAKRKVSAAGRKAIGDATRKRWAAKKGAAKAKPAVVKKAIAKKAAKKAPEQAAPAAQ